MATGFKLPASLFSNRFRKHIWFGYFSKIAFTSEIRQIILCGKECSIYFHRWDAIILCHSAYESTSNGINIFIINILRYILRACGMHWIRKSNMFQFPVKQIDKCPDKNIALWTFGSGLNQTEITAQVRVCANCSLKMFK